MKSELIINEINLHISRVEAILPDIKSWLPLNSDDFLDTEKVKTIDSFIFRFSKIQDKMGEKLFPFVLEILKEYKPQMPFVDILNKLEKLELIPSADKWIDYRNLRNILVHEYPDNEDEIIEALTLAVDVYNEMLSIFNGIVKLIIEREGDTTSEVDDGYKS